MSAESNVPTDDEVSYFRADKLVEHLQELEKHTADIPIDRFVKMSHEVVKMIRALGSALKMARDDIEEKSEILIVRKGELEERSKSSTSGTTKAPIKDGEGSPPENESEDEIRLTLQYMVKDEMRRKVHDIEKSSFHSGSRTLLRMMWFLDFTWKLLTELYDHHDKKLRTCASEAYEFGLAPHHPWMLRKTISAAFYALPYREDFMKHLAGGVDDPEIMNKLHAATSSLQKVRDSLWAFYKKHELTELP
eukprot:gb/GECG01016678.1/.p1 GENE.gb/GECG01016678.1/~~gb/GECG01016678.1/.p1  ORF type:complete len:249 (+),score=42.21 gb/GECG01016678.1/:1-747(+)